MKSFFITGIGTNVGKTVVAAIITEALKANYWKPIQAGLSEGTDQRLVQNLVLNNQSKFFNESYKLKLAASPHIAAREEGIKISVTKIYEDYNEIINTSSPNDILIIEGAGGILVPLNDDEFVIDLIQKLKATVILVSSNYLGSINHSLLTAEICKIKNIDIAGWIFNSQSKPFGISYENEIVDWSGFQKIASITYTENLNATFVFTKAALLKEKLLSLL